MKKLYTIIASSLALLLAEKGTAQNGGQFNENNVVKVSFDGNHLNEYYFKITSKQSCAADYKISYPTLDSTITIPALATVTIEVTIVSGAIFKVKAIQGTTCTSQPDMGWVEVSGLITLSLRNPNLQSRPLAKDEVKIWPNPCVNNITIKLKKEYSKPYHITMVNLLGNIKKDMLSYSNEFNIDASGLWRGVYIMNITDDLGMNILNTKITKTQN